MAFFPANENPETLYLEYYDTTRHKDYYAVGVPVYDDIDISKIIGFVAFDVSLSHISDLISSYKDMENQEAYLTNERGLLLSKSKFIGKDNKKGILLQTVESKIINSCVNNQNKRPNIEIGKNYVGNDILRVTAAVPEIKGCVIAERGINNRLEQYLLTL